MRYEFLPHTADVRMRIEAENLPLLFLAGLRGMGEILKENHCGKQHDSHFVKEIKITATDITCLLVDFLSDALSNSYTEGVVFCDLAIEAFSEHSIIARISGYGIDRFSEEIKAVTYHEAEVKKNETGNWETVIVFDI